MKNHIKNLVCERLSAKRIILWGIDKNAEEFYREHKEKLNISHCVSENEKDWGEGAFLGELDVKKYCKEELGENDYIVVCGSIAFRTIELQLKAEGLEMYEDFVESEIAAAIYSNKKIALFYGQCVLRDIHQCMLQVSAFTQIYTTVFTQVERNQAVVVNRLLYYMKDICDLYVYTPKILDKDSAYSVSVDELPEDCKVVSVSNLVLSTYWPEVNSSTQINNKWYLHPYNAIRDTIFYHTVYRHEDYNINRMLAEGKTATEIVETLSADNFYSEKEVQKNLDYSLKLIDMAEKRVDITMADFIRANYKKIMLYQNRTHPNACIIWEYVGRLLRKIDLSDKEVTCLERKSPKFVHHGGDAPIYPSVARYLQLDFVKEATKYEVMTGNGVVFLTFREYIEHYVEYTKKAMEIMSMW